MAKAKSKPKSDHEDGTTEGGKETKSRVALSHLFQIFRKTDEDDEPQPVGPNVVRSTEAKRLYQALKSMEKDPTAVYSVVRRTWYGESDGSIESL